MDKGAGSGRRPVVALLLIAALSAHAARAQVGVYPRPQQATHAMVVSAREEASRAGLEALQAGGNAIDAAVAAAFTLAVVHPMAGNLGGGGFMVIRLADGRATSFDFREMAPGAALADMYLDESGDVVPERSTRGHLASGVPGTVAGLLLAHQGYGALPRETVLAEAIRLARDGFVLTETQAERLNRFRPEFEAFPATRRYFTKGDGTSRFEAGERFVQDDLAAVLERIAALGHAGFYGGKTARLVEAEMRRGGGIMTREDLAAYRAVERPVVEGTYRGHRIISMAPPSSGGVALIQLLNAVEPYRLDTLGHQSSASVHLSAEAMRRVYADRARWLGDPAFVEVPVEALVHKEYVQSRMASFDPARTTDSDSVSAGEPLLAEPTETTHLSVVDSAGNAVSLTTTLNAWYGSKVVVDGAGFFMNNEMDDFAVRPGAPNLYQLISGEANAIAPGKRMVSSMTPTIVEDPHGRLRLVVGTPGGSTIITSVFQIVSNVIDHGMNVQQAVLAPRFHHQWRPDTLFFESRGLVRDVAENLARRGWTVVERPGTTGRAYAIEAVHADRQAAQAALSGSEMEGGRPRQGIESASSSPRMLFSGIDPRGEGAVAGY